jgi:2-iminobutanoate/2-iminopropanoate deaminase
VASLGGMELTPIDAATAPAPLGGYTNALQVDGASRLLFISGQIPATADGHTPADFESQCRLVWTNIHAALAAAGLGPANLVKVTTYLSNREHAAANGAIRRESLGDHRPALTVVIAKIFDPAWLLEIEAIAAA